MSEADRSAYNEAVNARRAEYRQIPDPLTIVVEVKTSRIDFRRDARPGGKFTRPRVADIQIIATPPLLIHLIDVPAGWWWLMNTSEKISILHRGDVVHTRVEQRLALVKAIAERRHNRTANAMWSALHKRQRLEIAGRKQGC